MNTLLSKLLLLSVLSFTTSAAFAFSSDFVFKGKEGFEHPLKTMCKDYVYGGNLSVLEKGVRVTEHFINCTGHDDKYSTLSSKFLLELDYKVELRGRLPVLDYHGQKIALDQF